MTIHLYAICWNEIRVLRFFFRHYDSLVDRFVMFDDGSTDGTLEYLRGKAKVEVRPFPRVHPDSFVFSQQALQDACWKESRGAANWVIVTCIPALGFQMVTRQFPHESEHLAIQRTWGAPDEEFNKLRIFDPEAVTVGGHSSYIDGRCVLPERDELLLFHYKYLGTDYVRERDPSLGRRLGPTDKDRHFGFQYFFSDEQYLRRHAQMLADAFDVTDPSYCPWRDHPAPRWWRK